MATPMVLMEWVIALPFPVSLHFHILSRIHLLLFQATW